MKVSIGFALLVFALVSVSAATGATKEQSTSATPASQKDVRQLEQQIKKMRLDALAAEKNAADKSEEEKQKIIEANNLAISAVEAKLAGQLKEADQKETQAREDEKRRAEIAAVAWLSIIVLLVVVLFFVLAKKSGKNKREVTRMPFLAPVPPAPTEERQEMPRIKKEILTDPEIKELKDFSARNNGVDKIPFIMTLRDGQQFNCLAELRDGLDPLVYIEKEKVGVAWDKRRQCAVKLSAQLGPYVVKSSGQDLT